MSEQTEHLELSIVELEQVGGGRGPWRVSTGLERSYVDALKSHQAVPNLHDGIISNGLRGNLPTGVTSKPRPWLRNQSIDQVTRGMQLNSGAGLPPTRWSP